MRVLLLALFSVVGAAASAQTPERFDLVCTGTTTSADKSTTPFSARYRIDLQGRKYCGPNCDAPETIALIEPDKLTLKNQGPVGGSLSSPVDGWSIVISRSDGAYEERFVMVVGGISLMTKGSCTVAEFTSFPKTLF